MSETQDQEAYCPLRSALDGTHQLCVKTCKLLLPDGGCSFVSLQASLTEAMREEVQGMIQQALQKERDDMLRAIRSSTF